MRFGFFIPAYNASTQLKLCVDSLSKTILKLGLVSSIHIVDDSSTDSTPEIARSLAKKPIKGIPIHYHRYDNGPSRRENLALEMSKSKEDYIIFMDVDLATDLKYLGRLCALLESGYDVVIGSRYLRDSRLSRSLGRLAISKCYNASLRLLFGSRISDHQCGFKGFKREAYSTIYEWLGYDTTMKRGWLIDAEMLILARILGMNIAELGITWTERKRSTFNVKRELRMLPYVFFVLPKKIARIKHGRHNRFVRPGKQG